MRRAGIAPWGALAVAGAVLVAAEVANGTTILVGDLRLPTLWIPSGILLASLLVVERRLGVLIAGAVAMVAALVWRQGWPVEAALGVGAIQALEVWGAALMLRRAFGEVSSLGVTRNIVLLVATVMGASVLGASAATAWLAVVAPSVPSLSAWLAWWAADAIGLLLATPISFAVAGGWRGDVVDRRTHAILEFTGMLVVAAVLAEGVFGERLPQQILTPAFILPVFLWASIRFGAAGASAGLLIVAAIGVWHTAHGQGPLALPETLPVNWIRRAQGTASMAGLSFMLLGSLVDERRKALQERADLVEKLQSALTELRVLQGLIPICAWCHRIRDDAGSWQRIETYVEANSAATFSHGICPTCVQKHEHDLGPTPGDARN